jgi:hypothetical protein
MKGLFKSKPRTPADLVRQTRELLGYVDASARELKREEKVRALHFSSLFWKLGSKIGIVLLKIAAQGSPFSSIIANSFYFVVRLCIENSARFL